MMRVAKNCPCYKDHKDCAQRKIDCHSTCAEYKMWAKMLEDDKALKKDNHEYLGYIVPKIYQRRKRKNEKSGS